MLEITEENDRGHLTPHELFFSKLGELTGETAEEVHAELQNNNQLNERLVSYIGNELKEKYRIGLISNSESPYLRNELDKV